MSGNAWEMTKEWSLSIGVDDTGDTPWPADGTLNSMYNGDATYAVTSAPKIGNPGGHGCRRRACVVAASTTARSPASTASPATTALPTVT